INYIVNPEHFTGRSDQVSLINQGTEGWSRIARQTRDVALMGILRGDHVAKHNIPGPPRFQQIVLWDSDGAAAWDEWNLLAETGIQEDPHGTGLAAFDVLTGLLLYGGLGIWIWAAA